MTKEINVKKESKLLEMFREDLFNLGLAFGKALKYSRLRKDNALR